MESEFYITLPSNSSMQYFPDNKTSNFVTKLSRTLQLDGEWEVGLAEIDYLHTWYNIREGKNSVEIYAPDKLYLVFQTVEYSIQPGYYEKVQDVIDALYKAGLANLTAVVLSYDDTFKRVTVKSGKRAVVKLRRDMARMLGEHGSYVSKNFERPHYVPLNKKIFDTISINIRDEAGDLVAFEHGKVIVTLHFRRSKTQYFI